MKVTLMVLLMLAACAPRVSAPMLVGPQQYMLTGTAGNGWQSANETLQAAVRAAQKACAPGMAKVVKTDVQDSGWSLPSAQVTYECVATP
jgi:hypothetical protein